jgi:outer membrane autotransporter protein
VDDDGVARAGGTLVMLQNEAEGPSDAHVDEFDLEDGGTLMVELTPEDDLVPGVEANTAVVNGRIFALYNPGFYDDETIYQDVVEAGAGGLTVDPNTFTVEDNSALLLTEPVVENDSIDLKVTRQGFGEVEGLSKNAKHAGNAIEKVYGDLDEESLFGQNVANLFTLADGDYQKFMNQVTGAEFANYLQSVLWSTRVIKRTITERMECDAGYAAGAVANVNGLQVKPSADLTPIGCFTPGTGHIWGRGSGTWNNLDGDNNAPGYDETQVSFTVGADYAFTDSFYAGIAGGWIKSEMDFDNFGGRSGASIDYQGWHIAGYGGYDNRVWYLRGIVDFASYDDCEAHRGIRQGTSLVDPSSDECDSSVIDGYGEAGYRWEFAPNYTLTPFVGVDVGHAELDSFNEKDPHDTGWALKVDDSDADSVETLVGGRFAGWWDFNGGVIRPEVMVAWAHEFEDPAEVDVAFRDAPRGANFSVEATDVGDNAIVAQVGGTWDITNQFQFGIKWDGRFNEDYNSNSVIGRLEYKF